LGTPAPDFELPVLNEGFFQGTPTTIRLSDLRGQHVILNFWGVRCAPCVIEHPELTKIWRRFEPRGLLVFGLLSPSESPERAMAWSSLNDPDGYPTLVSQDKTVGEDYRVSGIPHTYIIGPDGLVLFSSTGWNAEKKEELIRFLDEILPAPGGVADHVVSDGGDVPSQQVASAPLKLKPV
jgi:peroxiredoxin